MVGAAILIAPWKVAQLFEAPIETCNISAIGKRPASPHQLDLDQLLLDAILWLKLSLA